MVMAGEIFGWRHWEFSLVTFIHRVPSSLSEFFDRQPKGVRQEETGKVCDCDNGPICVEC